jgi:hypothetical protein
MLHPLSQKKNIPSVLLIWCVIPAPATYVLSVVDLKKSSTDSKGLLPLLTFLFHVLLTVYFSAGNCIVIICYPDKLINACDNSTR